MIDHIIREIITHSIQHKINEGVKGARCEHDHRTGGRLFRHHCLQRLLVVVLILVPIITWAYLSTLPDPHNQAHFTAWIMFSFSGLGLLLGPSFYRTRIIVTTDGLEGMRAYGAYVKMRWSDINRLEFSTLGNKFKFRSNYGECLAMSVVGTDLGPLLAACEDHLHGSMFQNLGAGYKHLQRELPAYDAFPRSE